ncbi:DNA-binding CsgD family transcriptional regulator [Paraburkholderia sp. BL6669N2]|uniref:helix-turn-helix transcriptional regulator n=1 Tax=unclassified Paraburkholderia TaxID=2615204 RepID=UPI000E24B7C7|nr:MULTISPECIES: helix-turn-helix transcriptional regulator [unclassified Paraburkholderia]REG50128.1 DNA-binding CsgD family transcriptional regulator [Paraburkholderia sp. BL6669N2]TDY23488.1 DNA-binding CsgD family transcriptional regulator [Paraburkholderia sp. BL6665CI2N2]
MTRVETIHRAIRHVYEAALAPNGWPGAIVSVTEAIGAPKAMLHVQATQAASCFAISTGLETEHARRLQREFETRLPGWIKAIPVGTPLRQTSAISDAEFRHTDIYNEVVRPAGGFYGIVAPLVRFPDRQVHFCAGRNLGTADFSDDDVGAASLIVPHLTTALQIGNRLAAADLRAKSAYDVITQLNIGVVLLDAAMHPIFVNRCAEALARTCDGLLLTGKDVSASRASDAKNLRDVITRAIGLNDTGRDASEAAVRPQVPMRCYLSRRPPRLPLVVRVLPVNASDMLEGISAGTRAALFVIELDKPVGIDPMVLAASFHLTRREAALAALLAQGMDLAEAASQSGIGIGTARGYLKQILAKTDTHRQAELVSLLLRGGLQIAR